MWIFADYGYLLPAITAEDDIMRKHEDWNLYSNNGEFTFQIRARLSEHLEHYLDNYGEEGTYGPIWRTPDHDYNFRVMTTQEAFAEAMKKSIMAIDYRNFKDQSTKYPRGKEYHDLLISIWSASCKLNEPGGIYGRWTPENPNGYGSVDSIFDKYVRDDDWVVGDSWRNENLNIESNDMDELISFMDEVDIPMAEWWEYSSPREFALLKPYLRKHFSNKTIKIMSKKNKNQSGVLIEEYEKSVENID